MDQRPSCYRLRNSEWGTTRPCEKADAVFRSTAHAIARFNGQELQCGQLMTANRFSYVSKHFAEAIVLRQINSGNTPLTPTAKHSDMDSGKPRLHSDYLPKMDLKHGLSNSKERNLASLRVNQRSISSTRRTLRWAGVHSKLKSTLSYSVRKVAC
jgi:hypothetical protein